MTDKNFTDITIVLDRSGSMAQIKDDMEGALKTFITDQQELDSVKEYRTAITLMEFDHEYKIVTRGTNLKHFKLPKLEPRGMTALWDAVGRAISETDKRLVEMPERRRASKVLFVIITDGMENASKIYSRNEVARMVSHHQDIYKWNFVFLGANIDSFAVASSLGINRGSTMSFAFNPIGVAASAGSLGVYTSGFKAGNENVAFSNTDYAIQNSAGSAVVNPTTDVKITTTSSSSTP